MMCLRTLVRRVTWDLFPVWIALCAAALLGSSFAGDARAQALPGGRQASDIMSCDPDAFEPDNTSATARLLPVNGVAQARTFNTSSDLDYARVDGLRPGGHYRVWTSDLGPGTDTFMFLYDKNMMELKNNDDVNRTLCLAGNLAYCASAVDWTAADAGPYYVLVLNLASGGACPSYQLTGNPVLVAIPLVLRELELTPTLTPTPTATSTQTPAETATATPTATSTVTASATFTPTMTGTPTATGSPTPTGTATGTPTETPTPTETGTSTPTGTPTATGTATATPTETGTSTPTSTPTGTPTGTPTATRTPSPTATSMATPTLVPTGVFPVIVQLPAGASPNGVAVNPDDHTIYVTGRNTNTLYVIDGTHYWLTAQIPVGSLPWGVAVNPRTHKVYVANWGTGDVYVLDSRSNAVLSVLHVGPNPTFVRVNTITNRVGVVTYGNSSVVVINGDTNAIESTASGFGFGAWGLAFDTSLNRIYVGTRDSGDVVTLDGNNGFKVIAAQTVKPCGGGGSAPFSLDFNAANNKLYVACAPAGNVNHAAVFRTASTGLTLLASPAIGNGGSDGGGGVAVDPTTGHVFFTNSAANTVTTLSGGTDAVIATTPAGLNPYGAAVDPVNQHVIIGNRNSNDVYVLLDNLTR